MLEEKEDTEHVRFAMQIVYFLINTKVSAMQSWTVTAYYSGLNFMTTLRCLKLFLTKCS